MRKLDDLTFDLMDILRSERVRWQTDEGLEKKSLQKWKEESKGNVVYLYNF